ncbi:MAG: ammonium transporter [Acidobacteria bacterium]|nr:ammonium transporter [Acidobacteriota bacterium]
METRVGNLEKRTGEHTKKLEKHDSQISELGEKAAGAEQKAAAADAKATQLQNQVVPDLKKKMDEVGENSGVTRRDLDRFWVLLAAVLVFFMQAGFKCLEVGVARREHDTPVGLMNLMNWLVLCVVFYVAGFGLMFGATFRGWIGVDLFFPTAAAVESSYHPLGMEFFLFQLAFAATAATIVDGAMAERTALHPYFIGTVLCGLLVYPVFGHWAWNPNGWLKNVGGYSFHDFAGSTVVHSVGAWMSVAGVLAAGPRRFRFTEPAGEFRSNSLGYAVLGVIMLWFGWWGFNGGSQLKYDGSIASIILNTNLAGASAGIAAYYHARRSGNNVAAKLIGGVLGGLVAITAGCDVASPASALVIGATAGIVHNLAFDWISRPHRLFSRQVNLDDVAGAIPVHGACGIWGTFMTGVVIALGPKGNFGHVAVQLLGIAAALIYAGLMSWALYWIVEQIWGLRVSILDEDGGLADPLLIDYQGTLRVSVLRAWGSWSRFRNFAEYMRSVQQHSPGARQARQEVTAALAAGRTQFIREDDTMATERDVNTALDNHFN